MKKTLILALTLTLLATAALADEISVWADTNGNTCTLNFVGPDLYNAYVVHKTVAGTTGSQFKVNNNTGWAFAAQVMNGFLAIGDAYTDLSLAYGGCLAGPSIVVVQLTAAIFAAPASDCGIIEIVGAPGKTTILSVNCNFAEVPALTGVFYLGASASSDCYCGVPFATEQSTWGKVKSLYR